MIQPWDRLFNTPCISSFNNLHLLSLNSSDGACRHIGAALIELEDTFDKTKWSLALAKNAYGKEERGHTMKLVI